MRIRLWIVGLLLVSAGSAQAQDMALSQILKEGESWQRIDNKLGEIGGLRWDEKASSLAVFNLEGKWLGFLGDDLKPINAKAEIEFLRHHVVLRNKMEYRVVNGKLLAKNQGEVKLPVKEIADVFAWDDGTLVVADPADKFLWTFRVGKDGTLGEGDRYFSLFVRRGETRSEAREMTIDNQQRLYVGTKEGVQVFDPTGRLCGVLTKPSTQAVTAIGFAGVLGDRLVIACGSELFARKMIARANYIPLTPPKKKQ